MIGDRLVVGICFADENWFPYWPTDNLPNALAAFHTACAQTCRYTQVAIFIGSLQPWFLNPIRYHHDRRDHSQRPFPSTFRTLVETFDHY